MQVHDLFSVEEWRSAFDRTTYAEGEVVREFDLQLESLMPYAEALESLKGEGKLLPDFSMVEAMSVLNIINVIFKRRQPNA